MTDDDYQMMAQRIRLMRADYKAQKIREGLDPSSPQAAYMDGRIAGLTDVLAYLCPNPQDN